MPVVLNHCHCLKVIYLLLNLDSCAVGRYFFLGGSVFVLKGLPPLNCCSKCLQVTHRSTVSSVESVTPIEDAF